MTRFGIGSSIRSSIRFVIPLVLAFAAGIGVAPMLEHMLPSAHAQASAPAPAAGLAPMIIDIGAIKEAELPTTPNPDLRSKTLVVTEWGTLAVQMGNVAKHFHANAHEIQYIVEGSGTAWLGDKKVEIRPGMLIIIPKGTAHAGTESTSGRFKAIAIKLPPQDPKDTNFIN